MPTDPLGHFTVTVILAHDDLAIMNGPDISAALDCLSLPVQHRGQESSMAIQKAMEVCFIPCYIIYTISYMISGVFA
jgi:hypothetical protein